MNELVEKWRIRAAEWLDLQEAADILRETKNDVFAEIMSAQDGSSIAERDRMARLSPEWKEFRDKMLEAEAQARRARMRLKYEQMIFDSWRTENANARTERIHG